jgi:hypothetical protein
MADPADDPLRFDEVTLDLLHIEDEGSFAHVALYRDLKQILRADGYRFRVMPERYRDRWERTLLLNLTFWTPEEQGDVLMAPSLPADVVAHVAWHHLAARALGDPGQAPSAEALFLGESIASAFDVYLVGRLLDHAPESLFLESQVPQMADKATDWGLDEAGFQALLAGIAAEPEAAFESLRQLLFDATLALYRCRGADEGLRALAAFDEHRFAPLLHRFELSNWVLHARTHARPEGRLTQADAATSVDRSLRSVSISLDWLTRSWVLPRLG